jgi:hypothetical protein
MRGETDRAALLREASTNMNDLREHKKTYLREAA